MRLVASAAAALVAPGKGILDADEGAATISARLAVAGIPATPENRRAYREMLITTPGLAEGHQRRDRVRGDAAPARRRGQDLPRHGGHDLPRR